MKALPLVLSMGDPAGIGPELIARLWREHPDAVAGVVVAGDEACLRRAVAVAGGAVALRRLDALGGVSGIAGELPFVQAGAPLAPPTWGRISAAAGRAAADAITWGAREALAGRAAALVTAPIHKAALAAAGLPYPGHTELLQALAAGHAGVRVDEMPVRMMLASPHLRTVLVSIHVSLRQALDAVTRDNVLSTVRITAAHFARLGRPDVRIAVAGLNPHAGEEGLFGREEIDHIAPAVAQARAEGLAVSGPHAPDTVFMRARQGEFDVVVAMYHDQGLIPVKYLGLEQGVNVTLGLPLVRTSPDHGTAFDIAGTGRADPASLLAAIAEAKRLTS